MSATTVEGAIVSLLEGSAAVTSIVGSRIYPSSDPQAVATPKLAYTRIDTVRNVAAGGRSNDGPTGKATARLQFDCWATSQLAAKQLAAAVRTALDGYAGVAAGIAINSLFIDDERDDPGQVFDGQAKAPQRTILDAKVTWDERQGG